tara:strand:- start:39 stop:533 length:495 start_codon:yes stop_codon:yes gene_type:complete
MKRENEFKLLNFILGMIWSEFKIKKHLKDPVRCLSDSESNNGGEPKFHSTYNLKNSTLLSEQAKKENNFEGGREKRTATSDHPIPLRYFIERMLKDRKITKRNFLKMLKLIKLIVITEEENKKLNKAGLRQKMPFEVKNVYNIQDEYARYKVVGINPVKRHNGA